MVNKSAFEELLDRLTLGKVDALRSEELDQARQLVWAAEFGSNLFDRNRRGLGSFSKALQCEYCQDGTEGRMIHLYDFDTGGYPTNCYRLAISLSCCGGADRPEEDDDDYEEPSRYDSTVHPRNTYQIHVGWGLGNGGADWVTEWTDHLTEKNWWHPSFLSEFREIDKAWTAAREKEWIASSRLLRPPPIVRSKNPRAIPARLRAWVLERDGFRCRRCGHTADDGIRLVIDHISPVAKGGSNDRDNLQTLCEPCNASKRDKEPHTHDLRGRGLPL